jgi:hypothetical protein
MNKAVVFRPGAKRRDNIREGFPGTGDEEAAPMRLASLSRTPSGGDHPASRASVHVKGFFNNLLVLIRKRGFPGWRNQGSALSFQPNIHEYNTASCPLHQEIFDFRMETNCQTPAHGLIDKASGME